MKFNNKLYQKVAYGILIVLFIFIIINCLSSKNKVIQNMSFREKTNLNSNTIEGFTSSKENKSNNDNGLFLLIERKLKGLTEELGGSAGKTEVKKILIDTRKICDLECAKCMINMIDEHKNTKSIDLDGLADDETSDNCIKRKKYTELSSSIKNVIDNL